MDEDDDDTVNVVLIVVIAIIALLLVGMIGFICYVRSREQKGNPYFATTDDGKTEKASNEMTHQ